jgi:hypothetical protein
VVENLSVVIHFGLCQGASGGFTAQLCFFVQNPREQLAELPPILVPRVSIRGFGGAFA